MIRIADDGDKTLIVTVNDVVVYTATRGQITSKGLDGVVQSVTAVAAAVGLIVDNRQTLV